MSDKITVKSVDLDLFQLPDALKNSLYMLAKGGECDHCLDRFVEYSEAFQKFKTITDVHRDFLKMPDVLRLNQVLAEYKSVSDLGEKLETVFAGQSHKLTVSYEGDAYYYTLVNVHSSVLHPVQLRIGRYNDVTPVLLPEDNPRFVVLQLKGFESSRIQIVTNGGDATVSKIPLDGFPPNNYIVIPVELHKDYVNASQMIELEFNAVLRSVIPGYNRIYMNDIPAVAPQLAVGNMAFTLASVANSGFDLTVFTGDKVKKQSFKEPSKKFEETVVKKAITPPPEVKVIVAPSPNVQPKRRIDLYLMMDISGSMEISRYLVVQNVVDIMAGIKKQGEYDEVWLGCSVFADEAFKEVLGLGPVTGETLTNLMLNLVDVKFGGSEEPLGEAILKALKKMPELSDEEKNRYSAHQRKILVITDDDGMGEEPKVWGSRLKDAKFIAKRNGVESDVVMVQPQEEKDRYKVILMEQLLRLKQYDALVEFAINSKSEDLRREASLTLAKSGNKRSLYKLIIEAKDNMIRLDALEALLNTKDSKLVGVLKGLALNSKDKKVRRRALADLIASGDTRVIEEFVAETSDVGSKISTALALYRQGEKAAGVKILTTLSFEDESPAVRERAKAALRFIQKQ